MFLVSLIIGKEIGSIIIDYNICLILSIIIIFIAFIVLIYIEIPSKKDTPLDLKEAYNYFIKNKTLMLYLITNMLSSLVWSTMLGMPLLTLTKNIGFSSKIASFIILGMGIITNILSLIIVKYLRFKNDHYNIIFKYGIRVLLYLLVVITNSKEMLFISILYMLLTDSTYSFIFSGYFINNIKEKYTFLLVTLKYCTSLIGNGIGVFLCGLVFNLDIRFIALPALIIGVIHYILGNILIMKKKKI